MNKDEVIWQRQGDAFIDPKTPENNIALPPKNAPNKVLKGGNATVYLVNQNGQNLALRKTEDSAKNPQEIALSAQKLEALLKTHNLAKYAVLSCQSFIGKTRKGHLRFFQLYPYANYQDGEYVYRLLKEENLKNKPFLPSSPASSDGFPSPSECSPNPKKLVSTPSSSLRIGCKTVDLRTSEDSELSVELSNSQDSNDFSDSNQNNSTKLAYFLASKLVEILTAFHQKKVFHLDLHPGNILFFINEINKTINIGLSDLEFIVFNDDFKKDIRIQHNLLPPEVRFYHGRKKNDQGALMYPPIDFDKPKERHHLTDEALYSLIDRWQLGLLLLYFVNHEEYQNLNHYLNSNIIDDNQDAYERYTNAVKQLANRFQQSSNNSTTASIIAGFLEPDPKKRMTLTAATELLRQEFVSKDFMNDTVDYLMERKKAMENKTNQLLNL